VIVRWADVDFVDNPGTYWCRGARLQIEPEHSKTPRRRSAAPRKSAPMRLYTRLYLSRQARSQRYRMQTDATRPFATHAMPVIRRWLYAGEKLVAFELA